MGIVYFIQTGQYGNIKIGYTKYLAQRIKTLQTGCAENLQLLGFINGDKGKERALHKQFREYHIKGEWFKLNSELIEYINLHSEMQQYIDLQVDIMKCQIYFKMTK